MAALVEKAVRATPHRVAHHAVLWDVDGTLCDSFRLAFDATTTVLARRGFAGISEEEYHRGTKYTTPERLARHCGLTPDVGKEEFERLGAELGAEFDALYIGLVDSRTAGFFSGMRDLVVDLGERGAPQAVLTNAAVKYAQAVLLSNNVSALFSVVHGADDVPKAKPAPDGLQLCAREVGVSPSDCVYIGDSPNDGAAAKAAGMRSIGVSWGSHSVESLVGAFDVVVSTVETLKAEVDAFLAGKKKKKKKKKKKSWVKTENKKKKKRHKKKKKNNRNKN
eukprot:NODE_15823_length_1028_cov_6.964484.p1 GENE.NODE_15823_length_1028_cov_6.964484~~NODE_15823_length_1028_cov_6.964484.p1  ORF type:complete len:279 (-),score=81.19 NODE_15823_length_1028_cov_6.964484:82-918(-)